jgi:hypothetical protein
VLLVGATATGVGPGATQAPHAISSSVTISSEQMRFIAKGSLRDRRTTGLDSTTGR